MIIFEDDIKYDGWVKPVLVFPILLLVVLGVLFYIDAHSSDIFPKEPASKSELAAIVLFASAVFVPAVYWVVMPRKICVTQEGIRLAFSGFTWNVPYKTIETIKPERGWIVFWAHTFITSYGSQIEIVRKNRLKIRICPRRRDEFVQYANRALEDWKRMRLSGG
jgi:hypothetical protein